MLSSSQITETARWARIPAAPLTESAAALREAIASGVQRKVEILVRECCPIEPWEWPEAIAFLQRTGQQGTSVQLASLVAHRLTRLYYLSARLKQAKDSIDHRMYWRLRPVVDSLTPPHCVSEEQHVRRFDDPYWVKHSPLKCKEVFCRCTIRSYNQRELDRSGLPLI